MGHQLSWNVQNQVTGEYIQTDDGVKVEYDSEALAQTAATYYYQATGDPHVVAGPHPKPHA